MFIVLGASALGSLAPVALRAAGARAASAAGTGAIATAVRLGAYFGALLGLDGRTPHHPARAPTSHPRPAPTPPTAPAGFGTLLSTALVHMLLPAAEAFASPCLPPWWASAYEAWPYALATLAILVMQLADFLLRGYARRATPRAEAHDAHAHAHGAEAKAAALQGAAVAAHPHPHPHPPAGAAGAGEADAEAGEANDGEGEGRHGGDERRLHGCAPLCPVRVRLHTARCAARSHRRLPQAPARSTAPAATRC